MTDTAIALSAHADDAHHAIGGTMLRMLETGKYDIYYIVFSIAEDSVPEGFPRDIVGKECIEGLVDLGLDEDKIIIHKYPVRKLPDYRQEILEHMTALRARIRPKIAFMPSLQDIHQDHAVVCQEGIRAFRKDSELYGYDFPWNVLYEQKLNHFVELSEVHVERKIRSLQFYKSQIGKKNNCFTSDYVRSLAVERGNRVGLQYAEGMEAMRTVWRI